MERNDFGIQIRRGRSGDRLLWPSKTANRMFWYPSSHISPHTPLYSYSLPLLSSLSDTSSFVVPLLISIRAYTALQAISTERAKGYWIGSRRTGLSSIVIPSNVSGPATPPSTFKAASYLSTQPPTKICMWTMYHGSSRHRILYFINTNLSLCTPVTLCIAVIRIDLCSGHLGLKYDKSSEPLTCSDYTNLSDSINY